MGCVSVCVLLALLVCVVGSSGVCPRPCACSSPAEVHCTFRALLSVPAGVSTHVQRINFGFNTISQISVESFRGLRKLELLMMHGNNVQDVPDGAFQDLLSLQVLKLSYNKLRVITGRTFSGLTGLVRLHLDHNHIESIHPGAFGGLTSLRLLQLESNRLTQLHPSTFSSFSLLRRFPVSALRHLHLSENQLHTLPSRLLELTPALENVHLHANPWSCDCTMSWIQDWSARNPGVLKCKKDRAFARGELCPLCASPKHLKGEDISNLKELVCSGPEIRSTGQNISREDAISEHLPIDRIKPPFGNASLGLSDEHGTKVDLKCQILEPRESKHAKISFNYVDSRQITANVSLILDVECPLKRDEYESFWRILAYYSEVPVHLRREIMLSREPMLSYRYKQDFEKEAYFYTGIRANVLAHPSWLMQSVINIKLNRLYSSSENVRLVFSTQLTANADEEMLRRWVMIERGNQTRTSFVVVVGGEIEMDCRVQSSGDADIHWIFPDGAKISAGFSRRDARASVSIRGKLHMTSVELKDSGVYYCVAEIEGEYDVLAFRLSVMQSSTPLSRQNVGNALTKFIGESAVLPCDSTSSPDAEVNWIFPDGSVLNMKTNTSEALIFPNGTLSFPHSQLNNNGYYKCVAVNQYGVDVLATKLTVMRRRGFSGIRKFPMKPQSAAGASTRVKAFLEDVDEASGNDSETQERMMENKSFVNRRRRPNLRTRGHGNIRPFRKGEASKSEFTKQRSVNTKKKIDPQKWADILAKIRAKNEVQIGNHENSRESVYNQTLTTQKKTGLQPNLGYETKQRERLVYKQNGNGNQSWADNAESSSGDGFSSSDYHTHTDQSRNIYQTTQPELHTASGGAVYIPDPTSVSHHVMTEVSNISAENNRARSESVIKPETEMKNKINVPEKTGVRSQIGGFDSGRVDSASFSTTSTVSPTQSRAKDQWRRQFGGRRRIKFRRPFLNPPTRRPWSTLTEERVHNPAVTLKASPRNSVEDALIPETTAAVHIYTTTPSVTTAVPLTTHIYSTTPLITTTIPLTTNIYSKIPSETTSVPETTNIYSTTSSKTASVPETTNITPSESMSVQITTEIYSTTLPETTSVPEYTDIYSTTPSETTSVPITTDIYSTTPSETMSVTLTTDIYSTTPSETMPVTITTDIYSTTPSESTSVPISTEIFSTTPSESRSVPESTDIYPTTPSETTSVPETTHIYSSTPSETTSVPETTNIYSTTPSETTSVPETTHIYSSTPSETTSVPETTHIYSTTPSETTSVPETTNIYSTTPFETTSVPISTNIYSTTPSETTSVPETTHIYSTTPSETTSVPETTNIYSTTPFETTSVLISTNIYSTTPSESTSVNPTVQRKLINAIEENISLPEEKPSSEIPQEKDSEVLQIQEATSSSSHLTSVDSGLEYEDVTSSEDDEDGSVHSSQAKVKTVLTTALPKAKMNGLTSTIEDVTPVDKSVVASIPRPQENTLSQPIKNFKEESVHNQTLPAQKETNEINLQPNLVSNKEQRERLVYKLNEQLIVPTASLNTLPTKTNKAIPVTTQLIGKVTKSTTTQLSGKVTSTTTDALFSTTTATPSTITAYTTISSRYPIPDNRIPFYFGNPETKHIDSRHRGIIPNANRRYPYYYSRNPSVNIRPGVMRTPPSVGLNLLNNIKTTTTPVKTTTQASFRPVGSSPKKQIPEFINRQTNAGVLSQGPPNLQMRPRISSSKLQTLSVNAGTDVRFPCESVGEPKPIVTWTKVSTGAVMSSSTRLQRFEVYPNGTFVIHGVQIQDRGQYVCRARNAFGVDQLILTLQVSSQAPKITLPRHQDVAVFLGNAALLDCQAHGLPIPNISWVLPDASIVRVVGDNNRRLMLFPNGTLQIKQTNYLDKGVYKCVASNSVGVDMLSVRLQVSALPPIIQEPRWENISISDGRPALLNCSAKGAPGPVVRWVTVSGAHLRPSQFISSNLFVFPNGTLFIRSPTQKDSGIYECVAVNSVGVAKRSVSLQVRGSSRAARIESSSARNTDVPYGATLHLQCSASGSPRPSLMWRTPDRKLIDAQYSFDSRMKVFPDGSLSIASVSERDEGDYLCLARNKMGDDYVLLKVNVMRKAAQISQTSERDRRVSYGGVLKMDCVASGLPNPEISWSLPDGTMINSIQNNNSSVRAKRFLMFDNGTLYLNEVGMTEEGDYTCYAQNRIGKDEMKVRIKILADAPVIRNNAYSVLKIPYGETAILNCSAKGDPNPSITWINPENRIIEPQSTHFQISNDGTLLIRKSGMLHTGNYTCLARNVAGMDRKVVFVDVLASLPVINGLERPGIVRKTVLKDQRVLLDCKANGHPYPRIMWVFPNNAVLPAPYYGSRVTVHRNGTLDIHTVRMSDSVELVCIARSEAGETKLQVNLEVTEDVEPPRLTGPPVETVLLTNGKTLALNCSITGRPVPEIHWTLPNGTSLPAGMSIFGFRHYPDGTLIIREPSFSDVGHYLCVGRNQFGSVEKSITLELRESENRNRVGSMEKSITLQSRQPENRNRVGSMQKSVTLESHEPENQNRVGSVEKSVTLESREPENRNRVGSVQKSVTLESHQPENPNHVRSVQKSVTLESRQPENPNHVRSVQKSVTLESRKTENLNSLISIANGEDLRLHCLSDNNPFSKLTWTLPNGTVLTHPHTSGRHLILTNGMLIVHRTSVYDRGTYVCRISNEFGSSSRSVSVIVIAFPPRITVGPAAVMYGRPGAPVSLVCSALASPRAEVVWELPDGTQIKTDVQTRLYGNKLIQPQGTLLIQSPSRRDAGRYRCTAKNVLGQDSRSTYVYVI